MRARKLHIYSDQLIAFTRQFSFFKKMFFVIVYLNHFIRKILFHFSIVDSRIMEDHDMKSTRRATSAKQVRNTNIEDK